MNMKRLTILWGHRDTLDWSQMTFADFEITPSMDDEAIASQIRERMMQQIRIIQDVLRGLGMANQKNKLKVLSCDAADLITIPYFFAAIEEQLQ